MDAEVVSDNVVGYQKIQLQEGYNMVGIQFSDLGGTAKDIGTMSVLDSSFAGYDDDYIFATEMRVWEGRGYGYYGWAGTSGTDIDGEPELDNTWTDSNAYAVEGVTMPTTSAAWIIAEKAGTMLISGEVLVSELTVPIQEGYNMIANPYPCDVSVTSFGTLDETFAGYDDDYIFATEMRVWEGRGYGYYGWAGTSGTDVDGEPELDNTWTDSNAYATDAVVPAGSGVWIIAEKAGTITFSPNL